MSERHLTHVFEYCSATFIEHHLREFVRTAEILTPACEASKVGTALRRQDPLECSFLLEFETPIEVERSEARI